MRALALASLVALTIASCGTGSRTVTVVDHPRVDEPAAGGPRSAGVVPLRRASYCQVYETGGTASLSFAAPHTQVEPFCEAWVRIEAKAGALWTQYKQPPPPDPTRVCYLGSGRGPFLVTAEVEDAEGEDAVGRAACEQLLATSSWAEIVTHGA
jgi:hypothetical protein